MSRRLLAAQVGSVAFALAAGVFVLRSLWQTSAGGGMAEWAVPSAVAAAIAAAVAAAALTSRFVLSPITRLACDLARTSQTRPVKPLGLMRPEEPAMLAAAFNDILVGLRRDMETLQEELVARESELAAACEKLRGVREKAEAADLAKNEFLAKVSHELRTPLNVILGMTNLLGEARLEPTEYRWLERMRSSAEELCRLLNDLLDLSRVSAGRLELECAAFRPKELFESVLSAFEMEAERKRIDLALNCGERIPAELSGDPTRIRQVLSNLIANALKFTEVGSVTVTADVVESTAATVTLELAVRDTGIGIEPADQERIFDPFTQVEGGRSRRYAGSGLGLAICKQLVEQMGGNIHVESQVGQGSCFRCTVVLEVPQSPARNVAGTPSEAVSPELLLGISPRPEMRRDLGRLADRLGWRLVLADSWETALPVMKRLVRRNDPPWLGVLDTSQGLSTMSGLEEFQKTPWLTIGDSHELRQVGLRILKELKELPEPRELRALLARARISVLSPDTPRVLVVEDLEPNRELLATMLEQIGCQPVLAESGTEALGLLDREAFDLMLVDSQMPGMSGEDLLRRIRQREKQTGGRLPAIVVTAHAMKGDRERYLALGMDGYVSKPVRRDHLLGAISQALNWAQTA